MAQARPSLGVNIDHVATLRQARYRSGDPGAGEPDPVRAVHEAELGGAGCITMHLREDRRHVNDRDVDLCRAVTRVKFNLEMGATDEMVATAIRVRADMVTLVPEGRQEVTTEGGLDVVKLHARLRPIVARLKDAGILVSAFVGADPAQVRAAKRAGFDVCELHTGPYASAFAACAGDTTKAALRAAWGEVERAAQATIKAGMRLNVGHALNYVNVGPVAALAGVWELHIGHAIVSRAVFTGLRVAVREMCGAIGA